LLLGRVGFGEAVDLTAIGPAIKTARSLEAVAKQQGCQIVVSREAAALAGWPAPEEVATEVELTGTGERIEVITMSRGRDMPATILAGGRGLSTMEEAEAGV
jgi:class 3 adenylate cyclase